MSLMKDGKLIKWSHFEAKGRRVNQDINKMHTVLRLIPMLRSDVLEKCRIVTGKQIGRAHV